MADKFRVIFASLDAGLDQQVAVSRLANKLNIPPAKAVTFFSKKPLFAPADKEKALKQAKLFASLGIQAKLQNVNAGAQTDNTARDERLFEALDYITSSLIRLEERLEDIEQQLEQRLNTPQTATELTIDEEENWEDDHYLDDLDIEPPVAKRSPIVLYSIVGTVALLIVLLALTLIYPDIMNF
ncbi:putative orphan protein [Pseudoalteromonas luteoviolacea B = ATCC 29581]|nr:putative orphan protein [Pseudoalteromonas luteoviolacea B = ATCC 29581]